MKRKIYSIIALAIMFLVAIPVRSAFISTGIGNVVTAPQPGKYYFIQGNAQYDNIITWLREYNGALVGFRGDEPYYGEHSEEYIWTFEVTDEGYAAKNYKTGRYICIEGTSNGGKVTMQDTPSYFTIEVSGEEVAFKNASGQYIDMAYYGTDPVTWSGGVSGSRRLTIYEVVLEEIPDFTHALSLLEDCYEQHIPYTGGFFEIGTEAGQYNCAEDYDQFESSLFRAEAILSDPEKAQEEGVTAEVIYDLINLIETLYAKILASKVPLTIADGNYRIVSAMEWTNTRQIDTGEVDENGNPITQTVTTHPTKAMYATLEGNAMWANIDSTDCRYLWNLTNNTETGFIKMKNIATDGILNDCSQSKQATLTADSQTEMKFEVIERIDDKVVVAMKPSTRGGYGYLHCNGHSGGSGTASNIVGWEASAPASQWILEPVSDQEVAELVDAFAPIKDHEILVSRFQDLIAEAEATIEQAKDEQYISERAADGLITDTLQFSSPFSDPTEGSFANVLNDDANTFWHSTWQEGNKQNHDHFFQVSFQEPVSGYVQSFMRRRAAINDHITKLGVFGTNNENVVSQQIAEGEWTNLTEDGWTNLGSYDLSKNASSALTTYSNTLDFGEGYKYLRFYIDGTTTGRGYGHFATFQLYKITIDGNTQWSQMGNVAAALDTAFITAQSIDMDEVEMSDYEALKQALDAFKAALVDPSALAAAINDIKDINQLIAIGDAPGFWKQDSNFGELSNTLQAAIAYLKGGAYTQEQVDAYTQALTTGKKDLFASANPVEEGKWYAIRFDTQEHYDAHGWNKDGAVNTTLGDLFENYAAPANVEDDELVSFWRLEDINVGQAVRFIDEDLIEEMDQVAFRFVAQGDSAFAIQHKSGLYLNGNSRSINLTLGLTPALFNVQAVGYGKVIIEARNLKGQGYFEEPVYLHAQNAGHSLVTWNNDYVGSSSALYIMPIEEKELNEGEDIAESVIMNAKPNSIAFMCYPTAFSVANAEIYAYQGAIADGDSAYYAFNKIEQAEPGQPVLLVVGDREDFVADSDDEEEPAKVSITPAGASFAVEPQTTGGVHGTYAYEWVDEGTVVVGGGSIGQAGNTLVLAEGKENTNCTRDVSANTGYIVYGENILKKASADDFQLVIKAGKPDFSIKGDLDGNGSVNLADALLILDKMAEGINDPMYDVDGDAKVNLADFLTILDIMAEQ